MIPSENSRTPYRKHKPGLLVDTLGKLPPQAIDLEEKVLGALMLENASLDVVENMLTPKVFYKEYHQLIYKAIQRLRAKDQAFDIVMVTNELRDTNDLDTVGGALYVTQLTSRIASSVNIGQWAGVVLQKYILREIIRLSNELSNQAFEGSSDPFDLTEQAIQSFEELNTFTDKMVQVDTVSAVDKVLSQVSAMSQVGTINVYKTGHDNFDQVVGIAPNEIMLIGGAAGQGKTRFVIALMKTILSRYKDKIAIQWFTFEDPKEKIIRCFACSTLFVKEGVISGKKGKMSAAHLNAFLSYMNEFKTHDIVFVEDSKYAKQVRTMFKAFCKARPNKFCICIIDNIMLLEDDSNDRDEIIAKELNRMRKQTGGLIMPIHHFNDDQMDKDQKKLAYRPRIVHLKGRESYRRVSTQVLLINKPGNYADLVAEYKGVEDIMKSLFIIDVAKNRDGSANDDAETLLRMWADLDYLIFKEI